MALNLLFAVTVVRLMWISFGGTDLYPDEAQYWIWSLHPALGYYSKPPLVAWLIALTTGALGESEGAIRLAAPLLHFGTGIFIYLCAERLFDHRVAFWSALAYITLPGVSVSAAILSTDAPLLFCWAVALYAFIRAREPKGETWWWAVGAAAGVGLLAKYAMAYWLLSALLFLLATRGERKHLTRFLLSAVLALLIYAPNFVWNYLHSFASYRHTGENAASHGPLFNVGHFLEFFGSQFGVFGPVLFAALIALVILRAKPLPRSPVALLAWFTLPTLLMMCVVSFISHAQPNWAAPVYVSAVMLTVAWLLARSWSKLVVAGIALNIAIVVAAFSAHDVAHAFGHDLRARFDPLHRLRGWNTLGNAVARSLGDHPDALLLSDDREDMAALTYYVHPHPFVALKWNGESAKVNDQFDLEARPEQFIGCNFVLVSHHPENLQRIVDRFASAGPVNHIVVPLGGGESRSYVVRYLTDFKGYAPR